MRQSKSSVKGVVPFGYQEDKVTPHPTEAGALREAARWIIEENRTPQFCAEEFNRRGLRRRLGKQFQGDALTKMLKNPRYAGIVVHFGVPTDEVPPWAPIFDMTTWQALQARLSRPGIRSEVNPNAVYLGTGIAECGVCSRPMVGHLTPGEGAKFLCSARTDVRRVRDGLRHPQIKAEWLHERMASGIFDVLHKHGTALTDTTNSIASINYKIGTLKAAKDSALGLVHDPANGITVADVGTRLRGFGHEVAVLEAERDDVLLQQALDKIDATDADAFRRSWDALTLEEQRRIARRVVVTTVHIGFGADRVHVVAIHS